MNSLFKDKRVFKNKKANMTDPIFLAFMLFSSFVSLIIVVVMWNSISPALMNAIESTDTDATTIAQINETHSKITSGLYFYDYMTPIYLIGIIAMIIISAFFIQSHPIFFFMSLFLLLIFVLVGVVFSNTYQTITNTTGIAETAAHFTITETIMYWLPTIMIVVFFVAALFLFAKPGTPPEGGAI